MSDIDNPAIAAQEKRDEPSAETLATAAREAIMRTEIDEGDVMHMDGDDWRVLAALVDAVAGPLPDIDLADFDMPDIDNDEPTRYTWIADEYGVYFYDGARWMESQEVCGLLNGDPASGG